MKLRGAGGAVADVGERHALLLANLRGQPNAGQHRHQLSEHADGCDDAASKIAKMGVGVTAARGPVLASHVLQEDIPGAVAADEHRAHVADHGADEVLRLQGAGRSDGNRFLAERRVNSTHHFALAVEIRQLLIDTAVQPQVVIQVVKLGAREIHEESYQFSVIGFQFSFLRNGLLGDQLPSEDDGPRRTNLSC